MDVFKYQPSGKSCFKAALASPSRRQMPTEITTNEEAPLAQPPTQNSATQTGPQGTGADYFSSPFWNRTHHKAKKRLDQPATTQNPSSLSRLHMPTQPLQEKGFHGSLLENRREMSIAPNFRIIPIQTSTILRQWNRTSHGYKCFIPAKKQSGNPMFWHPVSILLGLVSYCSDMS